jgi:GT2 family glycosyltransferase
MVASSAPEHFLNLRLKEKGYPLWRVGRALVCYHNSVSAGQFFQQRFHYGRLYASMRLKDSGFFRRYLYAFFCPLLPFLLTWRLGRTAFVRRNYRVCFLRALPWVFSYQCTWALGEFCGYLLGKGTSDQRVF